MKVEIAAYPTAWDWVEVKRRALLTVGKRPLTPPSEEWKREILAARHSPIRRLPFSFEMEVPYWVSVHLARHVHAQPYIRSQRNDRQDQYDRGAARQDAPVTMIWDMNAEELMVIANKRLCSMAAAETRAVVQKMCELAVEKCPEFESFLVPACEYNGKCHEMHGGCGRCK